MGISLTVELTAGTEIHCACVEMIALAKKLDMPISAKFNDVSLYAFGSDDPVDIAYAYMHAQKSKEKIKFASARQGQVWREREKTASEVLGRD